MRNFLFLLFLMIGGTWLSLHLNDLETNYQWGYHDSFKRPDYFIWKITLWCVVVITTLIQVFGHIPAWLEKKYNYNIFIKKREYFLEALNEARNKKREMEVVNILESIIELNSDLAEYQVKHSHFICGCYIDDRFLELKPII